MPAGAPFDVGVLFGDLFDEDALLLDVLPHMSTVCRSTYDGSTLGDAPCSAFRRRDRPPVAVDGSCCCADDDVVLICIDVVFGDAFCDEQAERLSVGARATTIPPPPPLLLLMVAEDSAADAGEGFGVFMVD